MCAFSCGDHVSYQGYDYATVMIGEQCWFAENLRSENYENGDAIPAGLSDSEWTSQPPELSRFMARVLRAGLATDYS